MRFASVENGLRYCFELGSSGNYGESVLAAYMATDHSRSAGNSGLTRQDHIAQAGKIHQLVRTALQPGLLLFVEAHYIVPGEPGSFLADRHSTNAKHGLCVDIADWSPQPTDEFAYTVDQVRRWAGMDPLVTQEEWSQQLALSTRALQMRNKELNRYLDERLNEAHNALQEEFWDLGWLAVNL